MLTCLPARQGFGVANDRMECGGVIYFPLFTFNFLIISIIAILCLCIVTMYVNETLNSRK
jgi:hypothetical protein